MRPVVAILESGLRSTKQINDSKDIQQHKMLASIDAIDRHAIIARAAHLLSQFAQSGIDAYEDLTNRIRRALRVIGGVDALCSIFQHYVHIIDTFSDDDVRGSDDESDSNDDDDDPQKRKERLAIIDVLRFSAMAIREACLDEGIHLQYLKFK